MSRTPQPPFAAPSASAAALMVDSLQKSRKPSPSHDDHPNGGVRASQGSGILAKNKTALFLATRKMKARTGLDFRPKNQSRLGGPPGQPGQIFFRITAGPGRDWIFYFAGGDGTRFFISRAGRLGDGTGFFISQTGLDFSRSSWEAMMRCLGEGSPV